jgi:hypothetical protein
VAILDELRRRFGGAIVETDDHRGDLTAVVARDALLGVLAHCRDDAALAFDVLMDLAVDYQKFLAEKTAPGRGRLPSLLDRAESPAAPKAADETTPCRPRWPSG